MHYENLGICKIIIIQERFNYKSIELKDDYINTELNVFPLKI